MATIRELKATFTAEAKGIKTAFKQIQEEAQKVSKVNKQATDDVNNQYEGVATSTGKLKQAIKDAGDPKAFTDLNRAIQKVEEEIEQTGQASEKSMQDLQKEVRSTSRVFDTMSDGTRKKFSDIKSSMQGLDSELKGLGTKNGLKQLDGDIDKTKRNLDGLEQESKELDDELKGLGDDNGLKGVQEDAEGVEGALGKLGGAGGAVAVAGGAFVAASAGLLGFVAAGAGIFGLVKSADGLKGATNDLQVQTGATKEEMEGLRESMLDIYGNNFGEDYKDIADSMAQVKGATKLTGEELQVATEQALLLRDSFGWEVPEQMQAARVMMSEFGYTSEEALNLLAQGQQLGINGAEDLLDTFNEYSGAFADVGFDGETAMNAIAAAVDAGARNTDVAADAINEFATRIRDGSDLTRESLERAGLDADNIIAKFEKGGPEAAEAFNQVTEAIGGIGSASEQEQIAVGLFGTLAEDAGVKTVLALGGAEKQADLTRDALGEMNEVKYDTIGEAITGLGRKAVTGILIPIQDRIMPGINKAIGGTIDFIETAAGAFKAFINGDESAEDVLMSYGLDPAKFDKIVQFGNLLQENLSKIRDRAAGAFSSIGQGVNAFQSNVLPILNSFIGAVQNIFNRLAPIVKPIIAAVVGFALQNFAKLYAFWQSDGQQILQAVTNVFNGIMAVIKFVMPFVLAIIKSVWGNIKGVISGALDVIMGLVKVFSGLFTGDFKKMWEGLVQIFKGAVTFIWNFVQLTLYGKILGGAKVFITAFKSFFTNMWKALVALFQGNVTRMLRLVTVGFGRMRQTAVDIFTKVLAFFRNTWATLKNITTGTINFLKTAFTNGFARMFSTVKTGLGNIKTWFTNIFRDIYNAVKGRFSDIVKLAQGLPKRIGDGIGKMASKVVSGTTKVINKMASTLGKGVNGVITGINWVLDKVGVSEKSQIPKWKVPQYAQGTKGNGAHPGGPMIVGDGKGSNKGPELIETPDGGQMLSPDTPTLMNGPKGTKVWSAKATKDILSMIPHYALGDKIRSAGEWAKDNLLDPAVSGVKAIGGKVKDVALNVFDYIKNPSGLLDLALKTLGINKPDGGSLGGDLARGGFNKIKNSAVGFIKDKLAGFGASQSGIALTGGNGGGFGAPFRFTSGPGPRNTGIPGASTYHKGWDWAAPVGTPIPSVTDGIGHRVGYHPLSGNFVEVRDNSGKVHRYQHNSRNMLSVGQPVKKGQTIALVGNTGVSSGPHLHYQVNGYEDGGIVDQAQLAWIAEGGWAESVISHDPAKRVSQKAIWEQTGKELGFDTNNPAVLDMLDRIRIAVEQGHVIEMSDKLVGRAVAPYVTKEQKRGRGIQSVFES